MDILKPVKALIKVREVQIDNCVFKLHCKVTVIMLMSFAILLTSKQLFGDPIHCIPGYQKLDKTAIDIYCWSHGTYTLKATLNGTKGIPGLGADTINGEIIEHKYYQWVCLFFFLQAVCFYLPRFIWKSWEGGRLQLLVSDLRQPLKSSNWNDEMKDKMVEYIVRGKYVHRLYAFRYAFCECLNFLNVIFQIFLMDLFLNGRFVCYGANYISWLNSGHEINPMTEIFPKLTKCNFKLVGASGDVEKIDSLCILTLNVLNEKLFLIIWFWLLFLSVVSLMAVFYRCFILSSRLARIYILRTLVRDLEKFEAVTVVNDMNYSDFFILYQLGKNLNPLIYQELVTAVYERLKVGKKISTPYRIFTDPTASSI